MIIKLNNSVKAGMRSKDFVSAFFIATTSGHNVQKWKGTKMSRKNGKKLLIAIAVGAVVVKAVRDGIKAKKQEEELRSALDDFYEEELNWWEREHEEGEKL